MPVELALFERRIGEQRRGHGLQRKRGAELLHHIGLGPEIEVHLNCTGASHHLCARGADAIHISVHQFVTPLGHQRHLVMGPMRRHAQTDKARANLVGHALHVPQVLVHLITGLVDGIERSPRQFQLTTGL